MAAANLGPKDAREGPRHDLRAAGSSMFGCRSRCRHAPEFGSLAVPRIVKCLPCDGRACAASLCGQFLPSALFAPGAGPSSRMGRVDQLTQACLQDAGGALGGRRREPCRRACCTGTESACQKRWKKRCVAAGPLSHWNPRSFRTECHSRRISRRHVLSRLLSVMVVLCRPLCACSAALPESELVRLAELGPKVRKTGTRDLPLLMSGIGAGDGATTVSATMWLANRAGIQVFVTGGIGGVHRGALHERREWEQSG